jgi:hypothetical protein
MSRPVAATLADTQLSDVQTAQVAVNMAVTKDWSQPEHCAAIMDPMCKAMPAEMRPECEHISKGLCAPGSAFIKCLLGAQAYEGCGTVGFPAGCLCSPQTLIVGDMPTAAAPVGSAAAGKKDNH